METTDCIITAGVFAGGIIGYLAAILMTAGKIKDAERKTWRQAENLHRARAIQDLRDTTRLF
ncbi:hypothetical protein [Luteolibacter marinus]|uniref:hypothetical protein n=1 Tax=Luteolibacter marinus TaxID=2776705 RepID=UPI001867AE3D|nr:hypothetical protein [Luteolibacter marinus]